MRTSAPELTDIERELIEERIAAGCSATCIAGRIGGRSRLAAVRRYIEERNLQELDASIITTVRELADDDFKPRIIALKLGVSTRAVQALLDNDNTDGSP